MPEESTDRKRVLFTVDPENLAYIKEKGKRFARGSRGGNSEALNRMVKLVRDWEEAQSA